MPAYVNAAMEEARQPAQRSFQSFLVRVHPSQASQTLCERLNCSDVEFVIMLKHGRASHKALSSSFCTLVGKIYCAQEIRAYSRFRNIKPPGSPDLSAGVVWGQAQSVGCQGFSLLSHAVIAVAVLVVRQGPCQCFILWGII